MYCIDKGLYNHFHELVQEKWETIDKKQALRTSGSALVSQIRLALTIWYLAGGSLWTIDDSFGLSVCVLYR